MRKAEHLLKVRSIHLHICSYGSISYLLSPRLSSASCQSSRNGPGGAAFPLTMVIWSFVFFFLLSLSRTVHVAYYMTRIDNTKTSLWESALGFGLWKRVRKTVVWYRFTDNTLISCHGYFSHLYREFNVILLLLERCIYDRFLKPCYQCCTSSTLHIIFLFNLGTMKIK